MSRREFAVRLSLAVILTPIALLGALIIGILLIQPVASLVSPFF